MIAVHLGPDKAVSILSALGVLLGITLAGFVAYELAHLALRRSLRGPGRDIQRSLVTNLRRPARFVVPLTALEIAIAAVSLPPPAGTVLVHAVGAALVAAVAWLIVRATFVLDDLVLARYQVDRPDNLRARRVHTQVQVLRRVTVLVVSVVAVAVVLLSFRPVRAAGAGLLASAGIVGIVAGVAAKPVATNLLAGLQIAISQPIRVDDVVVVDNYWGRVEEIALTYVVVRVWDLRRLVLPISYFITNPFENWTRSSSDILRWVYIEVDYSAPVGAIRERFEEILKESPDWDGKTGTLQVTQLGPVTMQLRALMSAADSSHAWNLQCEVQEKLVTFLQERYPWALPRLRTEQVAPAGNGNHGMAAWRGGQLRGGP
ncbi:MAG TPA: mechanosensitive ion channel domain-containing protein [Streptosporangiaceae bacterium]|nr:mechanosensitive ion channel domain-containing protein [Streptosporangiaceae bacterium]